MKQYDFGAIPKKVQKLKPTVKAGFSNDAKGNDQKHMRIVEGFILREIMDEIIAVPGGRAAERISGLVSLNGTGAFLFRQLQTEQTVETLTSAMQEEYEVDEATAAEDVREFLETMRQAELLVEE